jgi:hypothetical protein
MNRSLFALAALVACAPLEPSGEVLAWDEANVQPLAGDQVAPPTPADFFFDATNFIAGASNVLRITGGAPNSTVRIARSSAGVGAGPCPAALGGTCLPILGPAALLPLLFQTDSFGDATVTVSLPAALAGQDVALAAVILGANPMVSNAVGRTVHPVGTSLSSFGDADGDGVSPASGDCNDLDAFVYPGAGDIFGDAFDANCDGFDSSDLDGDGYETAPGGPDCDDDEVLANPGADEVCDGIDNDCDTLIDDGLFCSLSADFEVAGVPADVLFVMDDSCSMSEEQLALANNFVGRIQPLVSAGVDFHIGVVTTDVVALQRSGRLVQVGGYTYIDENTPSPETYFEAMINVGTMGDFTEAGRQAVKLALTEPLRSTDNAGFYRIAADLHIVVVSDENDQSANTPSRGDFIDYLNGLKPITLDVWFHSIVGPPGGCTGPGGSADTGDEYMAVTNAVGGVATSICSSDYSGVLDVLEDTLLDRNAASDQIFELTPPVDPATIGIVIDSPTLGQVLLSSADWVYDPAAYTVEIVGITLDPGTIVHVTWAP